MSEPQAKGKPAQPSGAPGQPQQYAKKPKLTKQEMRALQEQQRAAKAAKNAAQQGKKPEPKKGSEPAQPAKKPQNLQQEGAPAKPEQTKNRGPKSGSQKKAVELFSHLPQYQAASSETFKSDPHFENIHPEVIKLGLKYADWTISGSNARCVALLTALRAVIVDYKTPEGKILQRDLEIHLRPAIQYLVNCRPLSISMGNAIKFLKQKIHNTGTMSEDEAKKYILNEIDNFIQERIIAADELILEKGKQKIVDGDVVLTFGSSTSVEMILRAAFDLKKNFRVVIVDSRPSLEGKGLLLRLSNYGIDCTYVMYHGISFILDEVSKVFIGAHGMLSNGNVLSRCGTAAVAMMANRFNIPVIVCCETYKFAERAQLDAICLNEIGNPDLIVSPEVADWKTVDNLKLLNLSLDLTPVEFVTGVITELGMIPPTSVPVILREQNTIDGSSENA